MSSRGLLPLSVLALCLCVYGDALTEARHLVISSPTGDVASQFIYWRAYMVDALRQGRIPQWNPSVYGGVPFFGAWQAGILYPPNWLYLVLPLNIALNIDPIISTFLTGLFGAFLARKHGLHPLACLLTGAIMMLGGPFFSHVWSGHLSELAAMAWTPLILLAIESIIERPGLRPILLAAFALAMQILAGHPQTVFNTVILATIYATALILPIKGSGRVVFALVGAGALAGGLAAVQLLTGLQVNGEGARSSGVGIWFAGLFSLAPENLLTLAVQHPFGDIAHVPYFGRWMMWEESAFAGSASLLLSAIGWRYGRSPRRGLWLALFVLMSVLALGKYSPLFSILYNHVPGFSMLRSHGRFMYGAIVMLALLAGSGLDAVFCGLVRTRFSAAAFVLGIALAAGTAIMASPAGRTVIIGIWRLGDLTFNPRALQIDHLLSTGAAFAARQLGMAAFVSIAAGVLLWATGRSRRWAVALALLALLDLVLYARSSVTTFDPRASRPTLMAEWFHSQPGDYRILQQAYPFNSVMAFNQYDVWGYDPAVVRRYAQLVLAIEGQDPDAPLTNKPFTNRAPALRLVRCKYLFGTWGDHLFITEMSDPLPHALIVPHVRRLSGRDSIFRVLLSPGFDGRNDVVLEEDPQINGQSGAIQGTASARWKNGDTLEVNALTDSPAILLITDTYSKFWHVRPLAGCAQSNYRVMPGDYALMAIPLAAGRHHFLIRYTPPLYRVGLYISAASLGLFAALYFLTLRPLGLRR